MDANSVADYLKALKVRTGITTKSLSDLTNISEDTINNVLYARTSSPSLFVVADLVHALGGSLAELSDERIENDSAPQEGGVHLKIFEVYRQTMERGVRQRNIIIVALLALLTVFIAWLVWDITHPDAGLIRLKQMAGLLGLKM